MLRALRLLAVAVVVGILAACSSGSGYSDLDREATTADVLPPDLPAYASENHTDDSVRFVGEHDGVEYYLARSLPYDGACVVAYRSAEEWVGGCGGPGTLRLTSGELTVIVAPDGSPELDEGTRVGGNIVVP